MWQSEQLFPWGREQLDGAVHSESQKSNTPRPDGSRDRDRYLYTHPRDGDDLQMGNLLLIRGNALIEVELSAQQFNSSQKRSLGDAVMAKLPEASFA